MMRKTLPFLIVILILAFGSCTREDVKEDLEESLLLSRSFDNEPINVPCGIPRLKLMLEGALNAVRDSTLTAIFTSSGRVEYAVVKGQVNKVVVTRYPMGYVPQYTMYISEEYLGLSNNGAIFVVIHELYHIYLHSMGQSFGNDFDHSAMVSDGMYRDWVGKALGIPQYSYVLNYLVYSGTYQSPVYSNLPESKKQTIRTMCKEYDLPY